MSSSPVAAFLQTLRGKNVFFDILKCEHQDPNVRIAPMNLLNGVDAIHIRHVQVNDQKLRRKPLGERNRVVPVARLANHFKIRLQAE